MRSSGRPLPNRVSLVVAASADLSKRVGHWVEAGEVLGPAPGGHPDVVRSPVTGVIASVTPTGRVGVVLVVERRREYEEMDH